MVQTTTSPEDERQARLVERAMDELRRGWPVIVTDGETPLLVLATEVATTREVARMRRLAPELMLLLTAQRAAVLHLPPRDNFAAAIPFPVDGDLAVFTSLADATEDLERPLRGPYKTVIPPGLAAEGLKLAKQARLLPGLIGGPLALEGGRSIEDLARDADIFAVPAEAIRRHEGREAATLDIVTEARLPTDLASEGRLIAFRAAEGGQEHLAFIIGDPKPHDPVLLRLHSECFTGDLLGSLRCDCGDQLRGAVALMAKEGGILLYLRQEGRGIGLFNKLRAYHVQDEGFDTVDANTRLGFEADERLFRPAAAMLQRLGFGKVRLLTNNPDKVTGLAAAGVEVVERVPHAFPAHEHNADYLRTKARRSGHYLTLPPEADEEAGS